MFGCWQKTAADIPPVSSCTKTWSTVSCSVTQTYQCPEREVGTLVSSALRDAPQSFSWLLPWHLVVRTTGRTCSPSSVIGVAWLHLPTNFSDLRVFHALQFQKPFQQARAVHIIWIARRSGQQRQQRQRTTLAQQPCQLTRPFQPEPQSQDPQQQCSCAGRPGR